VIEFIICDDNKSRITKIEEHIDNFMGEHTKIRYTKKHFFGYGRNFYKCVEDLSTFKVYLLDINTKMGSGMDAARKIREVYDDWNSIIIIETIHVEERFAAETSRLYLMDFLDKRNNFYEYLDEDLNRIYKIYKKSSNTITLIENGKQVKVEQKDIVYIEKESDKRSSIVYTLHEKFTSNENISSLKEKLTDDFFPVSRSAIVNLTKIKAYDSKENEIEFINRLKMNNISRENRKFIKSYVSKNN